MDRPINVVHVEQVAWKDTALGDRYGWRRKQLGAAAGGVKIGCSLFELPPGRRSYPYHYHCANEEAIYVLEGSGSLRLPGGEITIGPGDYAALPATREGAHQVVNTSNVPLRYLCISTMLEPDLSVYPDSGKVGFFAGSAPGGSPERRSVEGFVRLESRVGYWEGED